LSNEWDKTNQPQLIAHTHKVQLLAGEHLVICPILNEYLIHINIETTN